jgi:hypothetical protein
MNQTFTIQKVEEIRPEILDIIYDKSMIASRYYATGLDRYMLLHIRTKPRLIPQPLWYYLIGKLLRLYEFKL